MIIKKQIINQELGTEFFEFTFNVQVAEDLKISTEKYNEIIELIEQKIKYDNRK
jgi:hypothetical protein